MKPNKVVGEKLQQLAVIILDKSCESIVPLEARIDAFKAVTAYYVGVSRVKRNPDDAPEETDSMEAIKRELASK